MMPVNPLRGGYTVATTSGMLFAAARPILPKILVNLLIPHSTAGGGKGAGEKTFDFSNICDIL